MDLEILYAKEFSLVNVIKAIHGNDGGFGKECKPGARSCLLIIIKEVQNLKKQGIDFLDCLKLNVGDDSSFLFWEDRWEGHALKDVFPRLYALEMCKNITIKDKFSDSSLDHSFRRCKKGGGEATQYDTLVDRLSNVTLVPQRDRYVRTLENLGLFSVASMRKVIDDKKTVSLSTRTRWVKYVPIKVNVFAWKVKMNAIPTRFNLSLRGIDIDSVTCPICEQGTETSTHLFFNCSLARQLFVKLTHWWNIPYDNVNSYDEWLSWLNFIRFSSKLKAMLEFYVMWWFLWMFQNKTLFDLKAPSKASLFEYIISSSYNWCRFRCKASFSWIDWLKNPYLIVL